MSCKPLLSTVNAASTAVAAGGTIPVGTVVRKRGVKDNCGNCPVDVSGNGIVIRQSGYYRFVMNLTFTGAAAGNVTVSLLQNGVPVPGYTATTTITTAGTQVVTLTIGAPDIRVFCGSVPSIFTFAVSTTGITFSNFAVSVNQE